MFKLPVDLLAKLKNSLKIESFEPCPANAYYGCQNCANACRNNTRCSSGCMAKAN